MKPKDKDYGFSIGQPIVIVQHGICGYIQQILFNTDGVQYQVSYWDDSIRRVEWVFAHEIQSMKEQELIVK